MRIRNGWTMIETRNIADDPENPREFSSMEYHLHFNKLDEMKKTRFRLNDDDGTRYFIGTFYGEFGTEDSFRPLDEVGEGYGCTEMEYKDENGDWQRL